MKTEEQGKASKSDRMWFRVSERQKALFERASDAQDTSVTEFVLSAATRAAEDTLADRRSFLLDDDAWQAFNEVLERPARELPRLRRLMDTPTVFDD